MQGAREALGRIDECLAKLREKAGNAVADADPAVLEQFSEALDKDLNVSGAWAVVFEWVRENNRLLNGGVVPEVAATALATWEKMNAVFGLGSAAELEVPAEMLALLEERQAARKARDFKRSDAIRDELKGKGWIIEDTPKGPKLKRL